MVTPGDTIKHIISTFISPVPSWQAFGQCQSAFPLGIGMLAPLRRLMSASAMWFARIPGSSSLFSISKDPHWLCVDASERAFVSSSLEFAACATPSPLPLRDNSWKGEVSVVSLRNTNAYLCPGLLESLAKSLSVIYSAGALDLSSNRMHPAERNRNVLIYGCNWAMERTAQGGGTPPPFLPSESWSWILRLSIGLSEYCGQLEKFNQVNCVGCGWSSVIDKS